ncbi:MAG: hypothetical protein AAFX55_06250 [Bacteroidota bacterium]
MAEASLFTISLFLITTVLTLWLFYKVGNSKSLIFGILIWMAIVGLLGIYGFFRVRDAIPPRFIFLLVPGVLFVIMLLTSKKGKAFTNQLDLKWLTLLHIIRIPVEIVLFFAFIEGLIPDVMTFEGYNYDILSGLTAPIIYYLVFVKKRLGKRGLLAWNFICLGLLLNILTIAVLSAQTPFQVFAFDQPNIGVTYFPFVWLPTVIVPMVLYAHLASIKQLLYSKETLKT